MRGGCGYDEISVEDRWTKSARIAGQNKFQTGFHKQDTEGDVQKQEKCPPVMANFWNKTINMRNGNGGCEWRGLRMSKSCTWNQIPVL